MKPFVVIPAKKVKAELAAIKGVVVRFSARASGWMNVELTHEWVSQICGNLSFNQRCLV